MMESYKHFLLACFLTLATYCQVSRQGDASSLPLEHRGGAGSSLYGPPPPPPDLYGPPGTHLAGNGLPPDDPWPLAAPEMPQIKHLQVQCEKTHMRVNIEFDRPFYGMIFSKGYYSDSHCIHLKPGTGHLSATFEIFLNSCGMTSSANHNTGLTGYGSGATPSGSYVENTIIIQYDPYVQEVWDQARKLRCTWYDFYEKAVTFRPFQVDMLHAVTANFLGDNLQCWMQIQVGKGPWASEVSGIVKIGQTMTMVLAIKDDENKFDMLVRNCVAHDGKRAPIQLVDQYGCVVRPKIMSKFQKIKNFGPSASVVSFAYFQAFKFPDSMNVHFQCVIQVCRYHCPEPKCGNGLLGGALGAGLGVGAGGYDNSLLPEYGAPPAVYPDPRHPTGPASAYSENKPEVVPAPLPEGSTNPPTGSGNEEEELHLGPPPLPGHSLYTTVKRKGGVAPDEIEGNLATIGGRPRSVEVELNQGRKRRATGTNRVYKRDAQEMTDVNTERIIQVVSPGDVNFALNGPTNNETVVIQSASSSDGESICMSVPSFVAGLVMLLLVFVVSCLVAAFLFVRVRAMDRKGAATTTFMHRGYDNADFVKVTN